MLLTGTYERSLDDKSRLAIPKRMRDAVGEENTVMYLTRGTDGSLTLYPEESFAMLGARLGSASPTAEKVRNYSRLLYAQAERVDVDKQGRIRIPPALAELASINKDVVLLGVRDQIEIWDKQAWSEHLSGMQGDYDQIAEEAFVTGNALPQSQPTEQTVLNQPSPETSHQTPTNKPR